MSASFAPKLLKLQLNLQRLELNLLDLYRGALVEDLNP